MSGLAVSELFGPTVQGEGPHTGRVCSFLRLMRCNLTCTWCDTPYTWDATRYDLAAETTYMSVDDVVTRVRRMGAHFLVVSGGEPLMNQRTTDWRALLMRMPVPVHVETNGTIAPDADTMRGVEFFSVSPKLPHSGVVRSKAIKPKALDVFARLAVQHRACFKYVVRDASDVQLVDTLVDELQLPRHSVYVMPEGITAEAQLSNLAEIALAAIACGLNLSPRLHVLAWGAERGR